MAGWHHRVDVSVSERWEAVKEGNPGLLQQVHGVAQSGRDLATEQRQVSGVLQGDKGTRCFFIFFSVMIYYGMLNIIPCAI